MNSLELRPNHIPVEVVQLDIADADIGDVDVNRVVEVCIICV